MAQYGPRPWAGPMGPGPGPEHFGQELFQKRYPENLNIACITTGCLCDVFAKKTRAEKCYNLAAVSRRDLSYETVSGLNTKTDQAVYRSKLKLCHVSPSGFS